MIKVKSPGKLFLAGEYAVVEDSQPAIVFSTDKFVEITLDKAESHDFGTIESYSGEKVKFFRDGKIYLERDDKKFEYVLLALNTVEEYLRDDIKNFDLYDIKITSQLEENGESLGLGSSGAVTVGLVKAVLKYYKQKYDSEDLFKISAIASLRKSFNISCGDLAAIAYKGLIYYKKFKLEQVKEFMAKKTLKETVNMHWSSLRIKKIRDPKQYNFLIGWSGKKASSIDLVGQFKKGAEGKEDLYQAFLEESKACVNDMFEGFLEGNEELIKENIDKNREILLKYSKEFGVEIETDTLKKGIEAVGEDGGSAKASGAGGGDCLIALLDEDIDQKPILEKWEDIPIKKLDIGVYEGVENV